MVLADGATLVPVRNRAVDSRHGEDRMLVKGKIGALLQGSLAPITTLLVLLHFRCCHLCLPAWLLCQCWIEPTGSVYPSAL